jgi:hypothetical protein
MAGAMMLAAPAVARAQALDNDRQAPQEYSDDDSQPLALVSYAMYPVGYAVEWLIARPLHWFARESPAEPIFRPESANRGLPPKIEYVPDNSVQSDIPAPVSSGNVGASAPPTAAPKPASNAQAQTPPASAPAGQPVIH